jgi:hypothetical protein
MFVRELPPSEKFYLYSLYRALAAFSGMVALDTRERDSTRSSTDDVW